MNYSITDIKHDQLKTIIREANENTPLRYKISEVMSVSRKCLFQLFEGHHDFVLLERAEYTYPTNQYRVAKVRFLEFVLHCATKSSGELATSCTFTKQQFNDFQVSDNQTRSDGVTELVAPEPEKNVSVLWDFS